MIFLLYWGFRGRHDILFQFHSLANGFQVIIGQPAHASFHLGLVTFSIKMHVHLRLVWGSNFAEITVKLVEVGVKVGKKRRGEGREVSKAFWEKVSGDAGFVFKLALRFR